MIDAFYLVFQKEALLLTITEVLSEISMEIKDSKLKSVQYCYLSPQWNMMSKTNTQMSTCRVDNTLPGGKYKILIKGESMDSAFS